jgi:hypothetical protein
MPSRFLAITAFAVCAPNAFAHPGHGKTDSNEPAHYLASLEHALPLALMALATLAIAWVATKSIRGILRQG